MKAINTIKTKRTTLFHTKSLVISILLCWLFPNNAWAYDAYVGGIYYNLNTTDRTAEVTYNQPDEPNNYSGAVDIPASFVYEGITYSVTGLGEFAFQCCTSLTSVEIPNSVTNIGIYTFSDCSGLTSVTIPNSVTSIGGFAFSGCIGLSSVTIPNSVTSIGGNAFGRCYSLTSVTIPNSVTSISGNAFGLCSGLTSVTIPNSVNSIGSGAFYGCTSLTSVTIPNSVTSIGDNAFSGCTGLTSVTIPNSVTEIGTVAFQGCTGLTSITVDAGNINYDSRNDCDAIIETATNTLITGCKNTVIPNSVKSIGESAFSGCTGLTSVTIPIRVTSIDSNAFTGCTGLTSVKIPNCVTSIDSYAFSGCTGLTSISAESEMPISISNSVFDRIDKSTCTLYIPTGSKSAYESAEGWSEFQNIVEYTPTPEVLATGSCGDNVHYTIYSDMTMVISGTGQMVMYLFGDPPTYDGYYGSIKKVIIEEGVIAIGPYAFIECTGLTSVTIPSSVNDIFLTPFAGCISLTTMTVASGNTTYDSRDNCNAIIKTSTNTLIAGCKNSIIPNSVTSIGERAFVGCTGMTTITIPNSVICIGDDAFSGCSSLTSVTIPNSVTIIGGGAFGNTTWFDNQPDGLIYINNVAYKYKGEMPEGTSIAIRNGTVSISGYAFRNCTGLTSVTIPNSVTSIGNGAFCDCTGLTSVTIPNSVTSIGSSAFSGCTGLTSVTIPSSVITIESSTFSGCIGLTSVTIPNSVTKIEKWAFSDCTGLTTVTIPNNVASIGSSAFSGCTGLTSVTIPSSVTTIESYIFYGCTGLTSVTIPNSVSSIGSSAFSGCTGLTSVTIPNSVTSIGGSAFYRCTGLTSVTIPSSVTSIGYEAFYGCTGLTSIFVESEMPISISNYVFQQVDKSICTLYVPKGSKSEYENAVGWRDFEHIVEVEFDTDISTLDNAIYVEQTEGRIGGTKDILVKMKNDFDVRGFQFTMELPEGTTVNSWTLNQGRMPAGTTMNKVFATESIDGNKINVVCALNDGQKTFTGNDGLIATVNVSFAEDMEEGTYPIYLTKNSISDATAQTQLVLSNIKSTLVLEDYVLGDTNGDGMVLVGDVISILNYIVGSPSTNFNAKAADVNGDGMILVGDVIAVLNIIVNQ